jgi:tetratricopeptide (TPR) repeat protein
MKNGSMAPCRFASSRDGSTPPVRLALLVLVLTVSGCGPGVSVARVVPAPYNLGNVKTVALLEARGTGPVDRFVNTLMYEERQRGFYSIVDARRYHVRNTDLARDRKGAAPLLKEVAADVFLEVRLWGCTSVLQNESVKKKDKDGHEYRKTLYWYRGECNAELDIVDGDGRELASFEVKGTHDGVKYEEPKDYEQEPALSRAVDEAAERAAGQFTPRRITESISLDEKAPLAKAGIAEIEAGRHDRARKLWEGALDANPASAGLLYNLGAVCEALGDARTARRYYEDALGLAPAKTEYRKALDKLEARQRDAEELRRRP